MTAEVNAAIEGVLEAGAQEVVVNDSHGTMRNLLPDMLHQKALLITGSPKPMSMMEGIQDGPYTCAMFVGYHARMNQTGVLSHTYWGTVVRDISLNGTLMGETGINAALAGSFGVPVTLVTGDDRVCHEAIGHIPGVLTAEVKQARGRYVARCLHPQVACKLIKEKAREAVTATVNPLVLPEPVTLELSFMNIGQAEAASGLPGVMQVDPTTLSFTGESMLQTFRMMRALLTLGGV
jgi:D-amino peptidase